MSAVTAVFPPHCDHNILFVFNSLRHASLSLRSRLGFCFEISKINFQYRCNKSSYCVIEAYTWCCIKWKIPLLGQRIEGKLQLGKSCGTVNNKRIPVQLLINLYRNAIQVALYVNVIKVLLIIYSFLTTYLV